jgi:hypothetical protein
VFALLDWCSLWLFHYLLSCSFDRSVIDDTILVRRSLKMNDRLDDLSSLLVLFYCSRIGMLDCWLILLFQMWWFIVEGAILVRLSLQKIDGLDDLFIVCNLLMWLNWFLGLMIGLAIPDEWIHCWGCYFGGTFSWSKTDLFCDLFITSTLLMWLNWFLGLMSCYSRWMDSLLRVLFWWDPFLDLRPICFVISLLLVLS